MKKIISILILSLIAFVFTQPALAGGLENCKKCCEKIGAGASACSSACTSGDAKTNFADKLTICQEQCDKITYTDPAIQQTARANCNSCCSSLGYAYGSPITNYQQISTLISTITRWFQGIVMAIAIIMIIYGGVLYITAGGS
ncbi:MAG: hypothetical protein ABIG90_03650, partial [bacterium]